MKVINLQYYNPKKYRLLKDGIQILVRDDVGSLTHFLSELIDFGIDLQAYYLLEKELNRVGKVPISVSYNGSVWTIEKVEDKTMMPANAQEHIKVDTLIPFSCHFNLFLVN